MSGLRSAHAASGAASTPASTASVASGCDPEFEEQPASAVSASTKVGFDILATTRHDAPRLRHECRRSLLYTAWVRVLFLDVDGVLNRTGYHPATSVGLRSWIETELAANLSEVL